MHFPTHLGIVALCRLRIPNPLNFLDARFWLIGTQQIESMSLNVDHTLPARRRFSAGVCFQHRAEFI